MTAMTSLSALALCMFISLAMAATLFVAISAPLRAFIAKMCPGPEGVGFWLRFTIVMLFLSPLFVSVSFGLPPTVQLKVLEVGEVVQRAVTASLVGAFLAMVGIGFWVSSLARRAPR
jgi:hypothetical protein